MSNPVLIPHEEYIALLEAKTFLQALEAFGVEDWHGYSEARLSLLEKELTTDDKSTNQGEQE